MSPLGLKKFRKYAMIHSFSAAQLSGIYPFSGQILSEVYNYNSGDNQVSRQVFFFLIKSVITPYSDTRISELNPFSGKILLEVT